VDGMFYFRDCIMEGGVDFYCPRGFAWAENCIFYANTGSAAIWHDGSGNVEHKTVLINCTFDGFKGFNLGRYHRDAQFYLINCRFSKNMADRDIYLVPTDNKILWGRRVFYFNCKKDDGNYKWFANNINPDKVSSINVSWLYQGAWEPDKMSN
jgi:pectinesterase